jgi:transketolase
LRRTFADELFKSMEKDPDIWVVSIDLGYKMWDQIRDTFPDRFINTGAAEQSALDIAVGLALKGKKPFVYTITSFYLRAAETISLYISHEQIPVRLIGAGRDDDYKHDGYSHNGTQAQKFIHDMDIDEYYPENKESVPQMVKAMVENDTPSFISLRR